MFAGLLKHGFGNIISLSLKHGFGNVISLSLKHGFGNVISLAVYNKPDQAPRYTLPLSHNLSCVCVCVCVCVSDQPISHHTQFGIQQAIVTA